MTNVTPPRERGGKTPVSNQLRRTTVIDAWPAQGVRDRLARCDSVLSSLVGKVRNDERRARWSARTFALPLISVLGPGMLPAKRLANHRCLR